MNLAWRLALLLLLPLIGCAHQGGARGSGSGPGPADALASAAAGSAAPAEEAVVVPGPDTKSGELEFEDEFAAEDARGTQVADPLAPWNRAMFVFNDKLYFWALKPAARAYRAVVPRLARTGVENFFHNLGTPVRFVSNVLQFKGREAGLELGRFMINTTWGVLGFGDLFAGNPEAQTPDADLGLTLARHGVGNGIYLVWPFLGPSTLRDSVGWLGGYFLDPISYVQPREASLGVRGYGQVNSLSFRIGDYESLKDAAIDPYLAVRDAYLQNRAKKARE